MTVFKFLLDTSAFVQAKRHHYGFDFCPAFWDWLVEQHGAEIVASIQAVYDEMKGKKDELSNWARDRGAGFFLVPNDSVFKCMERVSDWANQHPTYTPNAKRRFLSCADSWLVAHSLALGSTVVTHEVRDRKAGNIKIPEACDAFGVDCINPFQMLSAEKANFVKGPART